MQSFTTAKDTNKSPIDYGVTLALFEEWRSPRFGDSNPTQMNNHVWEWLIETKIDAYRAAKTLEAASSMQVKKPTWCFDRYGQSSTKMPDGRQIFIGGEYEDYYDPDFCIYNDVVVIDVAGSITIYGYPRADFPPTDFHSATLVDSTIIIIGNLGYAEERTEYLQQVFILDTHTFVMRRQETTGDFPRWIHGHEAHFVSAESSIYIKGGQIYRGTAHTLIENIDDWRLDLTDWRWEHLPQKNWSRWEIKRTDGKSNHLWEVRQALWHLEGNWIEDFQKSIKTLHTALGHELEVKVIRDIYNPDVPHEVVPEVEDEYQTYRILVDAVTVRYVEDMDSVQVTVEGRLPESTIAQLLENARYKLAYIENATCDIEVIT